ncbi:type II secretion system protein M [Lampropedia puyangensis]|uniref:Type II secretion system protein M n=1 Tax=Lampropedia puyangensis TaxID=1330072 RepID=A0A4S8F841_9BURK|nr:type II secretion system protein GspM [Lampropedia puyangensis]THU03758.1 type II secretion system protein M [Lampropedia puyangensis]
MNAPPSNAPASAWQTALHTLNAKWSHLQARERTLVALATTVVGFALLWLIAIAPAWKTYTSYTSNRQTIERQVQQMQAMRQYALQMQTHLDSSTSGGNQSTTGMVNAIHSSAQRLLGSTSSTPLTGDRVTVRFQNVPAAQLLQWLQQVRESTRAQAAQVQLNRASASTTDTADATRWSGHVVLALPIDMPR